MEMNNGHSSTAVLRIASEVKSIDDIINILCTRPTRSFIKGEPYSKRNPNSRKRECNLWLLESGLDGKESLESHIRQILQFMKVKADALEKLQLECEIDIMCSFASENGQGGFTMDHELLKELSVYLVDLVVNLYPPEAQDL